MFFVCPKCMGKLNITDAVARCDKGHSYDKSRYGYYNLLMADKGGTHGDNKEMILARREFLSRGFYEPLADRIAEICRGLLSEGAALLDAGLGEGYYTERISRKVADISGVHVAGFDISKDAVRQAAKRLASADLAVAGSYHMPVESESVDVLLNTFSPLAIEETRRVIRVGGAFVMAIPGEEHLFGLKSAIYKIPYKNTVANTHLDGFNLISREELKYPLNLNTREDIRSLFMMTPYAYRTSLEDREKVFSLDSLQTDAHFIILTYRKEKDKWI